MLSDASAFPLVKWSMVLVSKLFGHPVYILMKKSTHMNNYEIINTYTKKSLKALFFYSWIKLINHNLNCKPLFKPESYVTL